MHTPYTPCGAKWHGVTEIGNAPRHSVAHYRDQLSLIRPGQFLWTPYADCILPEYCIDSTASYLCDTYLVCWSFVEAHEAGRVCRQFNRYQRIPQYCDRMLHSSGHLSKSHRRGRKGADWAKVHKFFIDEWDLRHDRFQATFDHATATLGGRINPGYMAWYNRITVSYLVQPGTQSTDGMNEAASSNLLAVETLQGIWHLTSEHDTDPRFIQIRDMAASALRAMNHADAMEYPSSQRQNVVVPPRPPTSLRHGLPGVRTGGHGITRHHRLAQQQQPQPEYAVPEPLSPEYDPPGWSQLSGASIEPSQWGARASCDSFFGGVSDWDASQQGRDTYFQNYQFMDRVGEEEGQEEEGPEEEGGEEEGQEEEGPEEEGGEEHDEVIFRPPTAGSSRSSSTIGRAMQNVFRGFSTRKNKGKAPTKFTPPSR
ncbi:uncharacterized protein LOC121786963 [Salvia splendens]|uniref:uncharacterized protein LOC121786963 n=1 Tax=Salvia splendens TaxID=180675 RepID=UPI001C279255|nr:uncharacterized protein LOC121786963 [Salvia splendens]